MRSASAWIVSTNCLRCSSVNRSHRLTSVDEKPFTEVRGERSSCAIFEIISANRTSSMWLLRINRRTLLSPSALSDGFEQEDGSGDADVEGLSAGPGIGIPTSRPEGTRSSAGRPHASFPSTERYATGEIQRHRAAVFGRPQAAPRTWIAALFQGGYRGRQGGADEHGTRNRAPAAARTVLGWNGSTEPWVNMTAVAPAATADRTSVPAFPGSRTRARTTTRSGSSRARPPGRPAHRGRPQRRPGG